MEEAYSYLREEYDVRTALCKCSLSRKNSAIFVFTYVYSLDGANLYGKSKLLALILLPLGLPISSPEILESH